jgi:hypothetical protein
MKGTVLAILAAAALASVAGDSALAAGKLGGAGGMDEFVIAQPDDAPNGAGDEDVATLFTLGGKIGVAGGDE